MESDYELHYGLFETLKDEQLEKILEGNWSLSMKELCQAILNERKRRTQMEVP